jgi:PAS domain-containing protein
MALEIFHGAAIPRELTTAAMEFLWAKWKTLHGTGDLTLQRLLEESSYPLRSNSIVLQRSGDDFIYTYIGEAILRIAGTNRVGTLLSTNDNPLNVEYGTIYRKAADHMVPICIRYTSPRNQEGQLWLRLALPLKIGLHATHVVVYSELISHHMEVYDHLFRTAPDAMVIASPIINDVGHTKDGWVLMMNDRARALLKFSGSIGNLRLSQIPEFTTIDFWGRLYAPKPVDGLPPLSAAGFDVELMRFPNVFGLRLRPKGSMSLNETVPLAPLSA